MNTSKARIEFDRKQNKNMHELLLGPEPTTQKEKDIWNLKFLRYSIRYGSFSYRRGMIRTIERAIKRLEESDE